MCGESSKIQSSADKKPDTPVPSVPPTPIPIPDPQSTFLLNVATHLAKNTNPNISVSTAGKNKQSIALSNISEDDLTKLPYLTNTNQSKKITNFLNMGVSIIGDDGSRQIINIPGFSQMMQQSFSNSDSQASLAGAKTHTPFKQPFKTTRQAGSPPMSVGDLVDKLTALNPALPSTSGKPKTYHQMCGGRSDWHQVKSWTHFNPSPCERVHYVKSCTSWGAGIICSTTNHTTYCTSQI
jgi:hypothetical protein